MGILFVLIFWLVAGSLLALGAGAFLAAVVRSLTLGAEEGRNRAIWIAGLFPFLCVVWLLVTVIAQGIINETYFGRDGGIGDYRETPLPNGYVILMIDVWDHGMVYNPKTLPPDVIVGQDDNVSNVTELQLSGPYILGKIGKDVAYSYFLLDTRTGKRQFFPHIGEFIAAIQPLGITPQLEPIAKVYSRYGITWFDHLALAVMLGGPAIGFLMLCRLVWRVRRGRVAAEDNLAMIPPAA